MLELKNISKKYKDFEIRDISFSIKKGGYYAILGESGAGKSLLLEIITGLINPDKGEIFKNEEPIGKQSISNRKIGLLFQDYAIFPHLSVRANISYSLRKKFNKSEISVRVEKMAKKLEILNLLDRMPKTLSGGELQRVALARTLIMEPEILLLDEPLSSLDARLKNEFLPLLKNINKEGITILHVTHDFEEACALADEIIIMHEGKIIQKGKCKDIECFPANDFVANLIGNPNLYKIVSFLNKTATIIGGFKLKADINNNITQKKLIINPKEIIISDSIEEEKENCFVGKISFIAKLTNRTEIFADVGFRVKIILDSGKNETSPFKEEDVIKIYIPEIAIRLF
ncbi:MAG: ABC transporter ATP-binding protein [Bacteroidales bacterium]|nr:ABC transporter ATP-binding protein [Bacteroidales bacterium]